MITITNEDNMDLMARYEDNHFDLAIVDPEWGINAANPRKKPLIVKQKSGNLLSVINKTYLNKDWDKVAADSVYGNLLFKKSKNQIIWGANFFDWIVSKTFKPPRRKEYSSFINKYPRGWIIWDKLNGDSDQWDCELAWTSFNRPTEIHEFLWSGMIQGSTADGKIQEGNKKLNEKRIHPCQKPLQLCRWQLIEYAIKGFKILDTGFGSGTMILACHDYGYDLTACEIDKDYFDAAVKRFEQHKAQLKLF